MKWINLLRFAKTSLKTTLVVEFEFFLSLSWIKTLRPFFYLTLDNATYNCPCEKTGLGK